MKSHILLPSKLEEQKAEEIKRSNEKPNIKSKVEILPFEVWKKPEILKGSKMELSKVLNIMNRENKSISTYSDVRPLMLVHTKSETNFRRNYRANINSVIEKDNYLFDLLLDWGDGTSNGEDFRNSNEKSDQSETTKNINASFDEDSINRREEIEASIESLELKALMLLNNDEEILQQCQEKVKMHFEVSNIFLIFRNLSNQMKN